MNINLGMIFASKGTKKSQKVETPVCNGRKYEFGNVPFFNYAN